MNVEGMEKLIFTNVYFNMKIGLENNNERERKKAVTIYGMAQKICPIRQSWLSSSNQLWIELQIVNNFSFFIFLSETFV